MFFLLGKNQENQIRLQIRKPTTTLNFLYSGRWKECLSELLGTYLLVLVGPASVIAFSSNPNVSQIAALHFIAFSFGATVALIVLIFGDYGVQINPAVTFAHTVARLSSKELLVPYVSCQLFGGLLAGLTLQKLLNQIDATKNWGSTQLAIGVDTTIGLILEAAGTFVLSFSALLVSTHFRGRAKQALLMGTTLFILIVLIGPLTGASFNPARSLGPSVASGFFKDQYVYWLGPLLGGMLSGLVFKAIMGRREKAHPVCAN